MRELCGQGRTLRLSSGGIEGTPFSCICFEGLRGSVFVGAWFMTCLMRSGTAAGVTLSTMEKAGKSRTVVESSTSGFSGTGIFEAESMSFWGVAVSCAISPRTPIVDSRLHVAHHASPPPPLCSPSHQPHRAPSPSSPSHTIYAYSTPSQTHTIPPLRQS